MISEAVQAARGTGAESPRGDFCEPQVVPTEAPAPAHSCLCQDKLISWGCHWVPALEFKDPNLIDERDGS